MNKRNFKQEQNISAMCEAGAWLAKCSLWPSGHINFHDLNVVGNFIRRKLSSSKYHFNAYIEFCERVLLYRRYHSLNKGKTTLPSPTRWLEQQDGYALTDILYKSLSMKRVNESLFALEWKGLGEAFLDVVENDDIQVMDYWERWLIERNARTELLVFFLFAITYKRKSLNV